MLSLTSLLNIHTESILVMWYRPSIFTVTLISSYGIFLFIGPFSVVLSIAAISSLAENIFVHWDCPPLTTHYRVGDSPPSI